MVAVFILLGIVVAGMNLVNYRAVVDDAKETLVVLSHNKGTIPDLERPDDLPPWEKPEHDQLEDKSDAESEDDGEENADEENENDSINRPGQLGTDEDEDSFRGFGKNAEVFFESRFFSVLFDEEGNVTETNTRSIYMVTENDAIEISEQVYALQKEEGLTGDYLFQKTEEGDCTRITFLDCGRKLASARTFLLISLIAAFVGYAVFFFVIFFYSKRITKPVAESYEKQKRFITDAGHEIKTPLAIIKADSEVLEMDLPGNEWVEDIQKQTSRLASLTNDLVSLARMEEAGASLSKEELSLSALVEEEASAYEMLAQAGNKLLKLQIQPDLQFTGDEKAIRRLVNILMDNAMKYSPENTEVSLALFKNGTKIRLSVRNETEGEMSEQDLSLLFDRFYRMDASRNSETGGHGIGLSMAKAICEAHGGKISASSADGHSLTMEAILPAA